MTMVSHKSLALLAQEMEGELHYNELYRTLYATDASVYRALPEAVAIPKTVDDLRKLIGYARQHGSSLIPRTAGTSLAGQCVGEGIVVDVSRHFRQILEWNAEEQWVRVQPGVVRDELNAYLQPYGYFFSPITSTANRAMIGGMVGNNASGTTSIEYGVTRDKVLELKVLLSDGSAATFGPLSPAAFAAKCELDTLEGQLYRQIREMLSDPATRADIEAHFPKASIHRRNTGYAIDALLNNGVFGSGDEPFNFCKLLCGSEGTLAFITEIKLRVDPLPLPVPVVLAAHFRTIDASMRATQLAMRHAPSACELMDKIILDCTKENITYRKHRFFIDGDPMAVLMIEFRAKTAEQAHARAASLATDLAQAGLGYAYPIIPPQRVQEVWALRAAGLGLLANIPGDAKAVACIEDTAVALADLPDYIREFSDLMRNFGQEPVYYAHAGAGELHLRPILNLKRAQDQARFYEISKAVAELVKKYQG
ncbi:MAG: FAD-binding oxidoreductase, partial [Bacteroidetes bacterium]